MTFHIFYIFHDFPWLSFFPWLSLTFHDCGNPDELPQLFWLTRSVSQAAKYRSLQSSTNHWPIGRLEKGVLIYAQLNAVLFIGSLAAQLVYVKVALSEIQRQSLLPVKSIRPMKALWPSCAGKATMKNIPSKEFELTANSLRAHMKIMVSSFWGHSVSLQWTHKTTSHCELSASLQRTQWAHSPTTARWTHQDDLTNSSQQAHSESHLVSSLWGTWGSSKWAFLKFQWELQVT